MYDEVPWESPIGPDKVIDWGEKFQVTLAQ